MTERVFNIDALVNELEPVKPLNTRSTLMAVIGIAVVALFAISLTANPRVDVLAGQPAAMFIIRAGMLALLGVATAFSVLAMAQPSVGKHHNSWQIAMAFAALFPLGGVLAVMTGDNTLSVAPASSVYRCLGYSGITALATAIPMVISLRKGAPTNPERAGWLTGVASGGIGTFAYSFYCPFDSLAYTGVYFTLAVAVTAVAGRLIVPRLIRW